MKYFIEMFGEGREVTYSQYKEAMKEAGIKSGTVCVFDHKLFSGRIVETETRKELLIRAHNIFSCLAPKGKTLKKSFNRVLEYISELIAEEDKE